MPVQTILEHFREKTLLTDEDMSTIAGSFEAIRLPKKSIVLKKGQVARQAYWVVKGCIRVYYLKDQADISAYFFTEGMFTNACESFIDQKPSRHYMETTEASELLSISYTDLERIYTTIPSANRIFRQLMEARFANIHQSFTSQILDTPEERYLRLQQEQPDLLNRIPQHQIATYLGITPISLSRIRQRLRK